MANTSKLTYIDPHNLTDGRIKLLRVIEVDSDDMRPADILLCIWMLRGHLREEEMKYIYYHNKTAIEVEICALTAYLCYSC